MVKKKHFEQLAALLLITNVAAVAGPSLAQSSGKPVIRNDPGAQNSENQSAQETLDRRIGESVLERLRSDPAIDIEDLRVEVQGGIVTLRGRVATGAYKNLASMLADRVRGVVGVINLIEVLHGLDRLDRGAEGLAAPPE